MLFRAEVLETSWERPFRKHGCESGSRWCLDGLAYIKSLICGTPEKYGHRAADSWAVRFSTRIASSAESSWPERAPGRVGVAFVVSSPGSDISSVLIPECLNMLYHPRVWVSEYARKCMQKIKPWRRPQRLFCKHRAAHRLHVSNQHLW